MKSGKSSRKKVRKAFKLFYSSKKKRTGKLKVVKSRYRKQKVDLLKAFAIDD